MNPKSIKEPILLYLKELKPSLEKEGISEIGLFGSFAKDEATIYSDIVCLLGRQRHSVRFCGIFFRGFTHKNC